MPHSEPQQLTVEQALHQAVALQRSGQWQAAADRYRAILQVQPAHADANHNLGVLALQAGQQVAALGYFKTALENQPGVGQYWLSYIEALIVSDQLALAKAVLTQGRQHGLQGPAVDLLAQRADALPGAGLLHGAAVHREAGRYRDAIGLTRQWLTTHPDDAAAHALMAQLLLSDKQLPQAWDALNTALSLDPTLAVVQRNHARLLLKEQRNGEALAAALAAHAADQSNPENLAMLAATQIANNQLAPAAVLLADALQRQPRYAEALVNRAQLKLRANDPAAALADVRQALAIKPHLGEVWRLAISLHHQLGDEAGVLSALEQYLILEPHDVSCIMTLGERKRQAGRLSEALALFARATTLAPDNAAAWTNLGVTAHQLGQVEQAKLAYARALALEPQRAVALHNLGAIALADGEPASALRYFRRATEATPQQGESYLNLGHAFYDAHQSGAAMDAYRQACAVGNDSGPRAALFLAILHYLEGDLSACAGQLVSARPVVTAPGAADPSDRIYWTYVATLLAWHQKNQLAACAHGDAGKLYVVGDSHALAAHRVPVRYDGQAMVCEARWIAGIKQWHVASGKANRTRNMFDSVVASLPGGSTLLLCIGEIDCRHDEGILSAWKKHPEQPLATVMHNTLDRYIAHLTAVRARFGHRLVVCGIPASNARIDQLPAQERAQFLQLIHDVNLHLRLQAHAAGMDFLDVQTMTDRGDGISDQRWHLDAIHLLPSATVQAFAHHLQAAPPSPASKQTQA